MWSLLPLSLLACAPTVGPACEAYLACAADAGEGASTEAAYGVDSACWKTEGAAAICEAGCADAWAAAESAYPLTETCDAGDGPRAAEAFAIASDWTLTVTDVDATAPCDDISSGEARWAFVPGEGAAFRLDGRLTTDGRAFPTLDASCEVTWGGFACDPADGGGGATVTVTGSFTADMLAGDASIHIDTTDQDRETGEEVACSYTLRATGGPG